MNGWTCNRTDRMPCSVVVIARRPLPSLRRACVIVLARLLLRLEPASSSRRLGSCMKTLTRPSSSTTLTRCMSRPSYWTRSADSTSPRVLALHAPYRVGQAVARRATGSGPGGGLAAARADPRSGMRRQRWQHRHDGDGQQLQRWHWTAWHGSTSCRWILAVHSGASR